MHVPGSWYIRFFNLKFVGHCQMMTNQVLTSTFKKGVYSLVNFFLKSGSFFAWPTFELKLNKYLGWMVQKNDRNNKIHRHMVTVGLRSLLNLWNELKLWVHLFDIQGQIMFNWLFGLKVNCRYLKIKIQLMGSKLF